MSPLIIICATIVVLACLIGAIVTRNDDDASNGFGFVAIVVIALVAVGIWKMP